MNIHEYQAKLLFKEYGIPVPSGRHASTPTEANEAVSELPEGVIAVKSQIHAGGRGKGTFTDGYQGGVQIVQNKAQALEASSRMLGNTLVTVQTGPQGRKVQTIYFEEGSQLDKLFYLAILLDRATSKHVIIASTEGGVEIEEVAHNTPEKIVKEFIDPLVGIMPYNARNIAFKLGLEGEQLKQTIKLILNLFSLYIQKDCAMVEINPLAITKEGQVIALDAKVNFDSNALFKHPDIQALRDLNEEDEKEIEASKADLSYIALDGNIACLVNGAGLAMATMDIIKYFGGNPANFLDVGGSANEEQVTAAFRIILSDPNVKGILVNIFGGIMKCDTIAKGVIAAAKNVGIEVPLVVRLEGTNVDAGKALLAESGLDIVSADSLANAAEKVVNLVGSPVAG